MVELCSQELLHLVLDLYHCSDDKNLCEDKGTREGLEMGRLRCRGILPPGACRDLDLQRLVGIETF